MKNAFTLVEIIFIIVIAGVILSVAVIKFNSKDLLKGVEMVAKDIEYTKHLAIIFDTRRVNDYQIQLTENDIKEFEKGIINPVRQYWGIKFYDDYKIKENGKTKVLNNPIYSVFKSTFNKQINLDSLAIDYLNKQYVLGINNNKYFYEKTFKTSPRLDLRKNYGIKNIDFFGSCKGVKHIFFDEEGVPYANETSRKLSKINSECIIKFNNQKCIFVYPQTGYIKVEEKLCKNYN